MSDLADAGDAVIALESKLLRSGVVAAVFAAVPSCAWLDLQLASGSVVSVRREDCTAEVDLEPARQEAAKLAARQVAPPPPAAQATSKGGAQSKQTNEAEMAAIEKLADQLFTEVKDFVDRRLEGTMHWAGPHSATGTYRKGDCVQRDRSLFIAVVDVTTEVPGTSAHWRRLASS